MSAGTVPRRVTAADIARSVGVSRATVGFVLNETPGQTISPSTRERVLSEAARLGYRPHRAARALASGRSRIVLMVLPDWPIGYSIGRHIDESSSALDAAGFSLVAWTPHPGGRARPLWETLQPDVVLGLAPFSPTQLERIRATGAVVATPPLASDRREDAAFTIGPALQVDRLVAQGHRRLAFAGSPDPRLRRLDADRRRLAERTAEQAGVPFVAAALHESEAGSAVRGWLERGVTGVVAYNDDVAAAVVGAALRAGLRVPGDLAVVGHDDAPIARLLVPSLTTVHVDTSGLGPYLAALALSAVDGTAAPAPSGALPSLIVRESG